MEVTIETFEYKGLRKMFRVHYTAQITNDSVRKEIKETVGKFESLISIVKGKNYNGLATLRNNITP